MIREKIPAKRRRLLHILLEGRELHWDWETCRLGCNLVSWQEEWSISSISVFGRRDEYIHQETMFKCFIYLISACQTVSIVNGHQEKEREREEEEQRETKVLWNLKRKKKPGKHLHVACWRNGQSAENSSPLVSLLKPDSQSLPTVPTPFSCDSQVLCNCFTSLWFLWLLSPKSRMIINT